MPEAKFKKGTDKEEKAKVEPSLLYAVWRSSFAIGGHKAAFEVGTAFVGTGAPIEATIKAEEGGKIDKIKGKMKYNRYVGKVDVPEDLEIGDELFFKVKLSKNGLKGESDRIKVRPPVELKNLKWSAEEARRGDILTLSAEVVKGLNEGEEVILTIYEYDSDDAHDKIVELSGTVNDKKIEVQWEYEYHEDTDDIPDDEEASEYGGGYNPPEYFFTVAFGDIVVAGAEQESGLLTFKDTIEIAFCDHDGTPLSGEKYKITYADGSEVDGQTDDDGMIREDGVPPGPFRIEFPDQPGIEFSSGEDEHESTDDNSDSDSETQEAGS